METNSKLVYTGKTTVKFTDKDGKDISDEFTIKEDGTILYTGEGAMISVNVEL